MFESRGKVFDAWILFSSAGDEALPGGGEQMVLAAELLLLVVVVVCGVCTTSEYVYSSSSSPQLALCCLCNPGQLACHGPPQKRENIFTLLLLRSGITSLLALCRSRAHWDCL